MDILGTSKLMYVVKVTDETNEFYGLYYGGYNKAAERPYYVKKISKAKFYSNARDIFMRDYESIVTINFQISDDMVFEQEVSSTARYTNTVLTSNGIPLNSFSAQTSRRSVN